MIFDIPLHFSRSLITSFGTQISVRNRERIPASGPMLVISNHRSFLDAPLLMSVVNRSVRFACHHYMSQVPVIKELAATLGCLPLDRPGQRQRTFFNQATDLLRSNRSVGIFPEGTTPMVQVTTPNDMAPFHRGFAHLALQAPVNRLNILPVAISALEEHVSPVAPLKLLSLFDPSEPLFDQPGWHPSVNYQRVNLSIGHPIKITNLYREQYHGRKAGRVAKDLTHVCHTEISRLLQEGFS
ncbi:MAG: lysophospholipid acyltransferase family protein [Cyanobacteria bacterium P01_F01_bin.42]